MKEKEFNLSEKICGKPISDINAIMVGDVKEFIRRLKENISTDYEDVNECIKEEIDKLAGDELLK